MTGLRLTLGSSASPSFSSSTNSVTSTAASASFTAPSTPLASSSFGEAGMGVDEEVPAFVCVREGSSGDAFDDDAAGIGSR